MNENSTFIKDYNDGYFLTDPILFSKNHYPINKKWLLNEVETSSTFVKNPLFYGEAFKHKIIPIAPAKMEFKVKKNEEVSFNFKTLNKTNPKKISLVLFKNNDVNAFKIYDVKKENGIIEFKNKFKIKGYYDIHLKIDGDIVMTYTVKVNGDQFYLK